MAVEESFAIETISLTKIFPDWWGRPRVVAVDALDLRIRHNEIYGFLGPNGSGKTTTIKMILNLLHPSRGAALVLDRPAGDAATLSRVGYLPEESYLYPYLTARETLDFYGRLFDLPAAVRRSRIDTLLEMVGLAGMGSRAVGTFSKGMARRIGLAQALINDPDLLILDEPTSGMDPIGSRQIKDLLMVLAERGKTIFLSSHLLADVEDICDRICIMYGGKMQVEGPVKDLLEEHRKTLIQTGIVSEAAMEKIRHIIEKEEGRTCEISRPMDRLETFFVRTVTAARQAMQPTSGAGAGAGISGFLAENKPADTVLRQLVGAQPAETESPPDARTETVGRPMEDKGLLDSLSQGMDTPNAAEPAERPEKPQQRIDKGLLEGLRGQKETCDGTTEPTHGDGAKGPENA